MLTFLISRLPSSLHTRTSLGFPHHYVSSCISYSFSSVSKLSQSNVTEQNSDKNHSFTLSYLMNTCSLSPKVANQVSKSIELKDSVKPNSIINIFKSYDFSDTQISKIVTRCPRVLLADPKHNLLPRLRFIQSIGFSASEIPKLFCFNSTLLTWSLEKRIIPHYNALKSVINDDVKVRRCLKRSIWTIHSYDVTNMVPNIKVLRDEGVTQSSVAYLLLRRANLVFINRSMFGEYVKFVKEKGIEPFTTAFVEALIVVNQSSKSTWELKLETYERLGWSRAVALSAFCKVPLIMALSEEKIRDTMKFFIDEIGLRLEDIAGSPIILRYSLKRRIVPRWSVVKIPKMKGLIKNDISIIYVIVLAEKKFLENFVIKFQESVPQLLELYRGELRPLPEVQA